MRLFVVLLVLPFCLGIDPDFEFPEPLIQVFYPKGFQVSIPDQPGFTLFAVHINFNKEMEGREAGEVARDITRKKNGRWMYSDKTKKLKLGDTLYYWLYVIYDGLGYELLDQVYTVREYSQDVIFPEATIQPPMIDIRGECRPTRSTKNGKPACANQQLFFTSFKDLNLWEHEVYFSNEPETSFTAFTKESSFIENDQLVIQPQLLEQLSNSTFVERGMLALDQCTSKSSSDCKRQAVSWSILPPIISSRLTTKNTFSFKYGDVEVRAKVPRGDWIVPEIWLEPKEKTYGDSSGRIYLGHVFGNHNLKRPDIGEDLGNTILREGYAIDSTRTRFFKQASTNGSLGSTFHNYQLKWTPEKLQFFIDGVEVGSEEPRAQPLLTGISNSNLIAPFDQEFYLHIGLHVGGAVDFPDNIVSNDKVKPWKNDETKRTLNFWRKKSDWYPTWNLKNNRLKINHIRVTAL